ncbi:hypothetical protein ZOSMA_307G00060 [Zostera marina]|uniref:Zinc finger, RING/FYVE/PHD-type n=1 Tax=Zostera marina TaxID=29655 RepID=A0A0K9PCA0_ZOSMR|nr:hypothetical protein ZOSMA_307G00060 [Zostera marina]
MMEFKGNCKSADVCALHKQWDELSCSICMECPHNAVLLMCSSHDKGCRSYICDTSYRHSNCLDRLKKLRLIANPTTSQTVSERNTMGGATEEEDYNEERINERRLEETRREGLMINDLDESNAGGGNTMEPTGILKCPLCRGTVFGWKIVKDAREYLDLKSRSCSRESCSFSGSYRELRRHARRLHPTTRPADVEPSRQRAWRRLERQRDYGDILSAIRSAMPGTAVLGDYVTDNTMVDRSDGRSNVGGEQEDDGGAWWTTFFLLHMFTNPLGNSFSDTRSSPRAWRSYRRRPTAQSTLWGENLLGLHDNEDDEEVDVQIPRRRRRIVRSRVDDEDFP